MRIVDTGAARYLITSLPHNTHAPALLNYLITSQQLAVRRTRKQQIKEQETSKGVAVETGCSDLYDVIY